MDSNETEMGELDEKKAGRLSKLTLPLDFSDEGYKSSVVREYSCAKASNEPSSMDPFNVD